MTLKGLERQWKQVGLRAACLLLGVQGRRAGPPSWGSRPARILFLRQDRIGDAIVSSGLLRALKGGVPALSIDALASPANAAVLERDPSIDLVHVFDKRKPRALPALARQLRKRRYDAVIDCMVTAPSMTGLLLMAASGARHRIGIAGRGVDAALTFPVAPKPGAEHIIDLLSALVAPFGIDREAMDFRPAIVMTTEEIARAERSWGGVDGGSRKRLLVNLSAGRADRNWNDGHFVSTVRRMRARFPEIEATMVGAPGEWERVRRVALEAGVSALRTPRLADVMGLVATADLIFTPDTSIAHMASAFRKPAVVMYRSSEAAAQWGLYGTPGVTLSSPGATLADLPLEPVAEGLERLIVSILADG